MLGVAQSETERAQRETESAQREAESLGRTWVAMIVDAGWRFITTAELLGLFRKWFRLLGRQFNTTVLHAHALPLPLPLLALFACLSAQMKVLQMAPLS